MSQCSEPLLMTICLCCSWEKKTNYRIESSKAVKITQMLIKTSGQLNLDYSVGILFIFCKIITNVLFHWWRKPHFYIFTKVHFRTCAFFSILFFLHKQLYFCLNTESEYFCHFWQNPRTALTTFIHSDSSWTQKTIYASGVAAVTVGHVCIKQKRACSSFRSWPIFQRLERLWLIFISALEWLLWVLDEWASLLWNATCAARVTVALKPDWYASGTDSSDRFLSTP